MIDKIPIKSFKHDVIEETYTLGTLVLTKGEYANAEKINEVIDEIIELREKISKLEGR